MDEHRAHPLQGSLGLSNYYTPLEVPIMSPTYRYGMVITGVNYAPGDVTDPSNVWMAETLEDCKRILKCASRNFHWDSDLDGNGNRIANTPVFGYEGDGALVFRVMRDDPQFAEVLDEPGDRARHAYAWLDTSYPVSRLTFGPRGGLSAERV